MSGDLLRVTLAAGLAVAAGVPSDAIEAHWTRLIGTGDPIPGAPAGTTFAEVTGGQPAGQNVVFYGRNASGSVRGF